MPRNRRGHAPLQQSAAVAAPSERSFLKTHLGLLVALGVIFFLTTDDRHVGQIADGRQMIWTAVAITETGEIGQASGRDLAYPRVKDSVSRFGMGMTLAQLPAAWLAPRIEERFGPSSSQPLFLVAPFVFVIVAALFSGAAARELGGTIWTQRISIILASLGSPLAAYVALDLSEPLQAAALTGAFVAALIASRPEYRKAAVAAAGAGFCVGLAILTKSALTAVAPFALIPLLGVAPLRRARLLLSAVLGAVFPLAIWATFEIVRFGRLFGGYAGETFSHPWFDGLWRLLIGPNFGLLLFFPAVVTLPIIGWRARREGNERLWLATLAALGVLGALLAIAASWWAWYGISPWGPRLIIPAIPLVGALAALEVAHWRKAAAMALVAASILLNVAPLIQHPVPVMNFRIASTWPLASADDIAGLPFFALRKEGDVVRVMPDQVLSTVPASSSFITLPWFRFATSGSTDDNLRRLALPPWLGSRPDIVPPPLSADSARVFPRAPGWRWWGRGFHPDPFDQDYGNVYDSALANQILRAQQMGERDLALSLSSKLVRLAPRGFHAALFLESYRLLDRRADAAEWLSSRPAAERAHPAINVVLALFERDAGNEPGARSLLASSARAFPDSPVQRALSQPLAAWPTTFASMTSDDSLELRAPGH